MSDFSDRSDKSDWETNPPDEFANIMICLINQASFLLWKQLQRLEQDFIKNGGFTEKLYKARQNYRNKNV